MQANLDTAAEATDPAIIRSKRAGVAQKANQILLQPHTQQRPLQIALGYSRNIYFCITKRAVENKKTFKS